MIFALFFSKTSAGKKLIVMAIHFTHKFFSFLPFGRNDMRTTTTVVHANDSKDVSSEVEVEVELSKQNNPSNSDVSAAVPKDNESDQSNDSDESQKPSPGNVDVAGR